MRQEVERLGQARSMGGGVSILRQVAIFKFSYENAIISFVILVSEGYVNNMTAKWKGANLIEKFYYRT